MTALDSGSLHSVHVDPEKGFSGGEVQVFLLLEGLLARGHRCTLIANPGSAVERVARERDIDVECVPMRGDWDFLAVRRMKSIFRRLKPNVVHLHTGRANWLGGRAAYAAGVPAVSTRRMDRPVKVNAKNRRIYQRYVQATAAISPAVLEQLLAGGVPAERCELIWSSLDPTRLTACSTRAQSRSELNVSPEQPLALAAGALVPRKGFDRLIQAFADGPAQHPSSPVLLIAGEGPGRANLEELIGQLECGASVRLLGQRAGMGDLLQAADLFCMPSLAEGLGIAALEAMAAGLPVLASRVGGLGDLVLHDVTGWLLEPDDGPGWRDALHSWLSEPARMAGFVEASKARVAEFFLPEQMVSAYERLYPAACARKQS